MIQYIARYSDTEESDKRGRWARKVVFRGLCIGWISKLENDTSTKFSVSGNFPGTGDMETLHRVCDTFKESCDLLESEWELFRNKIK